MASRADASIYFDTRLDPSGFERGVDHIDRSFESMKGTLVDVASATNEIFSDKAQRNINNLTVKLGRQLEQLDKSRASVARLREEYEKATSGDFTPRSMLEMQKELQKINLEKEKELQNNERILNSYVEVGEAVSDLEQRKAAFVLIDGEAVSNVEHARNAFNRLGDELEESGQRLEGMDARANSLSQGIEQIRLNPETSYEARKLGEEISFAEERTNRLSHEAQITERNIKEAFNEAVPSKWNETVAKTNKTTKRLSNSLKGVKRDSNSILAPLERMGKSIVRMARFTFFYSVFRKMFTSLRQYIQGLMSTQTEYINSLNEVKVNLMTAFQPIFTAIMPALNTLMSALSKATAYLAQFISMLFGSTYEDSRNAAKAINEQSDALKNLGKSAGKAMKGLQGFDQLNRQQSQGSGADSEAGQFTQLFDKAELPEFNSKILEGLAGLIEKIKKSLKPTIKAFEDLWERGLKPLLKFTWDNLGAFWNEFLSPLGEWVLGVGFPRFVEITTDMLASFDLDTLTIALTNLWKALKPFAEKVGEGLLWAYENILVPLATFAINDLLPEFLGLVTDALNFLDEVIEVIRPSLEYIWHEFLIPIASWVADTVIDALHLLGEAFEKVANWIGQNSEKISKAFKLIGDVLSFVWNYVLEPVLGIAWEYVKETFMNILDLILGVVEGLLVALGGFADFLGGMFSGDIDRMLKGFANMFIGIGNAIIAAFEGIVNLIIGGINKLIIGGLNALLGLGEYIGINIQIPEIPKLSLGRIPTLSISSSSGSFSAAKPPSLSNVRSNIPALAQGGLIPPRKPRTVIVGDNMYEDEIVSPRSAIREEVKNAISEMGGIGNDTQIISLLGRILTAINSGHTIEMDSRELGRTVVNTIKNVQNQTGMTQIQTARGR